MFSKIKKLDLLRSVRQIVSLMAVQVFTGRRVLALIRAGGLGDTICILSSLGPLRAAQPDLWIVILTPHQCSSLIDTFSLVDQAADLGSLFHYYCKLTVPVSQYKKMSFSREQGDYKIASVKSLSKDFASSLGVDADDYAGEFRIPSDAVRRLRKITPFPLEGSKPIVILHTGPTWPVKEFPPEGWNELVRLIRENCSVEVVQIGFDQTLSMDASPSAYLLSHATSLVNQLSLIEVAALMKFGRVFIGIDSGPLHIASRQNIPTVALFGPTLPEHILSRMENCRPCIADLSCIGCHYHESGPAHWKSGCPHDILCMRSLSPCVVFEEVKKILQATDIESNQMVVRVERA